MQILFLETFIYIYIYIYTLFECCLEILGYRKRYRDYKESVVKLVILLDAIFYYISRYLQKWQ